MLIVPGGTSMAGTAVGIGSAPDMGMVPLIVGGGVRNAWEGRVGSGVGEIVGGSGVTVSVGEGIGMEVAVDVDVGRGVRVGEGEGVGEGGKGEGVEVGGEVGIGEGVGGDQADRETVGASVGRARAGISRLLERNAPTILPMANISNPRNTNPITVLARFIAPSLSGNSKPSLG